MFEGTREAQALDAVTGSASPLSIALLAHVGVATAIVALSLIAVPRVVGPDLPTVFVFVPPPPPGDEPILATTHRAPRRGDDGPAHAVSVPAALPRDLNPPIETPERLPTPDPLAGPDGGGSDGPVGVPNGLDDGLPDGTGSGSSGPVGDGVPGDGSSVVTGDMIPPVLLERTEPVYPNTARVARLSGKVILQAVVGLDGGVESVTVLQASNSLFTEAAAEAVKKWRYRPATMNGRPVRVYFTVSVAFVMR